MHLACAILAVLGFRTFKDKTFVHPSAAATAKTAQLITRCCQDIAIQLPGCSVDSPGNGSDRHANTITAEIVASALDRHGPSLRGARGLILDTLLSSDNIHSATASPGCQSASAAGCRADSDAWWTDYSDKVCQHVDLETLFIFIQHNHSLRSRRSQPSVPHSVWLGQAVPVRIISC